MASTTSVTSYEYPNFPMALLPRPGLTPLEQVPYAHPRQSVMRTSETGYWTFSCLGVAGVNLADAFEGRLPDLDGPEDMLLPNDFLKVSILIHLPGGGAFRRVKIVQRVRRGARLSTPRRRVVEYIAEAATLYISQSAASSTVTIELRGLYLLALHRYGRTLVPVFGYMPTAYDVAPDVELHLLADLMGSLWDHWEW